LSGAMPQLTVLRPCRILGGHRPPFLCQDAAMRIRTFTPFLCAGLLGACLVALPGCRPQANDEVVAPADTRAARKPAQAVRQLTAHLRANELEAFAMEAVPPEMHERLVVAWSEGRTRWPLDELPF